MAVIESKGDGFSLFNGVKFPSLPVWDKETYPYALIYNYNGTRNTLLVTSVPMVKVADLDRIKATADGYRMLQNKTDDSPWVLGNQVATSAGWVANGLPIWSSYDILNEDGTTYLTASDPISLDGMNVIEWDGDTTGLELFPVGAGYYKISDSVNADISKATAVVRRIASGETTQSVENWSANDGYYSAKNFVRYNAVANETVLSTGFFAKSAASYRVSIFAYYPIEEEPKPISYIEYLANPKYRMGKPFRGFFGWLWARKHIGGGGSDVAKSALVSSDGYTLQDVNGMNLTPKEDE